MRKAGDCSRPFFLAAPIFRVLPGNWDKAGWPILHTQRLALRAMRLSDLDELLGVFSMAKAMREWRNPPPQSPRGRSNQRLRLNPPKPHLCQQLARQGHWKGRVWHVAETGYILDPDQRRRGFAQKPLGDKSQGFAAAVLIRHIEINAARAPQANVKPTAVFGAA